MDTNLPSHYQFELAKWKSQLDNASREQAIDLAFQAYELYLLQKHTTHLLIGEILDGN